MIGDDGSGLARLRPSQLVVSAVVGVLPVGALVALRLGSDGDQLELVMARLLFWTMPFVVLYVGGLACWRWRVVAMPMSGQLRQVVLGGGLYAVVLTGLLFWLVPAQLRVQFDETSIVGVSQNMQRLDAAMMTTGAIPYEGSVLPLENTVDKRPPLFAFVVSVVHRVAGYRPENAFLVNGALLALGLFVVFRAVRGRLGPSAAYAAPLCLLAVPLTGAVATSAGFELMASVWFLVALLAALDFVRQPDHARFAGLLAAGMLLAQSRYESLPAAVLLFAIVWWRVRRRYRPSWSGLTLLALFPALLLPLLFLLLHAQNPKFYPEAGGAALVSFAHFGEHVGPLVLEWFDPSLANALPGLLAALAVLAFGARCWRRRHRSERVVSGDDLSVGLPVLAVTAMALAWFYGDVREQTALRLFLPLAWLTALLPLSLFDGLGRRSALVVLGLLTAHAALRVRELGSGRAFPTTRIAILTRELDRLVARLPGDAARRLWVGSPAQYLIIRGNAALPVVGFERRLADVQQLLRRGDIVEIYILETSIDAAMAPALGEPGEVLRRYPNEIVEQVGGAMPITVRRLLH